MVFLDLSDLPFGWERKILEDGTVVFIELVFRPYSLWLFLINQEQRRFVTQTEQISEILENFLLFQITTKKRHYKCVLLSFLLSNIHQKTSYTDPRLAFCKNKSKSKSKMNDPTSMQYVNANSAALDLIRDRDLTGLRAIVTGGTNGVGEEPC